MSRSASRSLAISFLLCAVLVAGCGTDAKNAPVAGGPASGQASSLDDLEKIIEAERGDGGHAVRDQAFALIKSGKTLEAEKLMLDRVRDVEAKHGVESASFAWAQFDLATVYLGLDQMPQSLDAMRKACAVKLPDNRQATKDRLTFLMNLGELLDHAGEPDEAQQVLREGLRERETFYGHTHAGYAYGLEPLAALLLKAGQHDEALTLIEEAVAIYKQNEHPNMVTSMALRAAILAESKAAGPLFAGHEQLSEQLLLDLAHSIPRRISSEQPEAGQAMCVELHTIVAGRFGERHQDALQLLAIQSNMERALGNHAAREQTLRKILAARDAIGQPGPAIDLLKAIAIAQGDAKKTAEAEETYLAALARAEKLGHAAFESDVLRNYGLFLAELERFEDARPRLEAALVKAKSAGGELVGVSQIALGIFCQHRGDLERARTLLAAGVAALDPLTTDALCGRSHLTAIETGADCGCSEATMNAAISAAIRQYVQERLPKGLSSDLTISRDPDKEWRVAVKSEKELTLDEQAEINRVVEHALAHFRRQIAQGAYAPAYSQLRK